jgi:hypothetical protein
MQMHTLEVYKTVDTLISISGVCSSGKISFRSSGGVDFSLYQCENMNAG